MLKLEPVPMILTLNQSGLDCASALQGREVDGAETE